MKEAIERLREAVKHEEAIVMAVRRIVAELWLDLGPKGFWPIAHEFMGMKGKVIFPDEFYKDEIAAVKAERERAMFDAEKEDLSDPEVYLKPKPGDRLTAEQMKDAPDGTVVRHPHDATMRFERMDGKWYMQGTNTLPVDVLGGNFWPIVRWGNPSC